ncbi:type II toxin-antitoxin system VapC family toxin [Geobacter grbiciae]|uniref:type II toxin-antitoxin system VapC family toxin n=1 Tax=Geobacter grbiciae TaxID=155042 RepID=UPI001C0111F0|nr:type II toxin-antitoxin system VapC family toxin [Geobacter grbiciae]MBT1075475.1 type II toxin-antitoxin system VapC family toxin [Geobacter grbiciae]
MAGQVLVDSNVLLDVLEDDQKWYGWSSEQLARCAENSVLVINPIIYSEVSIGFERVEDIEDALPGSEFVRRPLPWEAAFLAGKCFLTYRRSGGIRRSPLPDFFIGAHALVDGMELLTRDAARYRTYFPRLRLIAP